MNFRMKIWTRNRSENKRSLLEQVWSDQLTWIEWTKIVKFDFIINNIDDATTVNKTKLKKLDAYCDHFGEYFQVYNN